MHELSLCRSIHAIVTRAARGQTVAAIDLDVGELRQVVPATLTYCWGIVAEATGLAGSELRVNHCPALLECLECAAQTRLDRPPRLRCQACGSANVQVTGGEEFLVRSIDIAQVPSSAAPGQ
jgi:hydrogenase nickel incorporation protein HypA/HybF